jgi:hypothetical protein
MNKTKLKSPKDLKICCSFVKFMEVNKITTELEDALVGIYWDYLERKGDLCEKCKYNGKREKK